MKIKLYINNSFLFSKYIRMRNVCKNNPKINPRTHQRTKLNSFSIYICLCKFITFDHLMSFSLFLHTRMLLLIFYAFSKRKLCTAESFLHTHTGNRFADQLLDVKLKVLCMSQTHIRIIRGLHCHSNVLNSKSLIFCPQKFYFFCYMKNKKKEIHKLCIY